MSRRERIDDELLVLRCQSGETAAFEELVGRWQLRLWQHAWRLTAEEHAAWDALQETWIAVNRGFGRLEDAAAFRPWVYRILSNKCRDWVRRERRRRRATEAYSQQQQQQQQPSAAQGTSGQAPQQIDLAEALRRLPGRDRAILALRYEEDFDTGEIAEILAIPPGTVKSRLHYARKRLRHYLEEQPHD